MHCKPESLGTGTRIGIILKIKTAGFNFKPKSLGTYNITGRVFKIINSADFSFKPQIYRNREGKMANP